jgi:8-oxo-dGTP diphosphatase
VKLYLVRHAKAGERGAWPGDDRLRPLSRRGQLQSEGLIAVFEDRKVDRLLSSSYVRCLETLVPLASVRNLPIEPADALSEGATLDAALTLVRKHAHRHTVMCSHGDIIPMLLNHYAERGLDLGDDPQCPKGCTWILDVHATGDVKSAKYVAPPSDFVPPAPKSRK